MIISDFVNSNILIQNCTLEHCELLFKWVNDPGVRENSINSELISWEQHVSWFTKKMNSDNSIIYIGFIDNIPFGQVRFDLIETNFLIDYSIDKAFRGNGFGVSLLRLAIEKLKTAKNTKINLLAKVKNTNIASVKVFQKLNFIIITDTQHNEIMSFLLEKN